MTDWKEYITTETITLVVSITTLIVSIAALIVAKRAYNYNRAKDKRLHIATLIVSIAALIVAKRAYNYNRAKDKRLHKMAIAQKEAQLEAMETASRFGFVGDTQTMANKMSLEKEIDILKRQ